MIATENYDKALERLCKAAIKRRLGDISGFPKDLVVCISRIYRKFIMSYLNILRQEENKPTDWIPEDLSIDAELADGMRHFFSDYQHITKEYYEINRKMDWLQEVDKVSHQNLYEHRIEKILTQFCQQAKDTVKNENFG